MEREGRTYCDNCDIIPTRIYDVRGKKVCKKCKTHFEECGKFIRKKVQHNYKEAQELIDVFHEEVFGKKKVIAHDVRRGIEKGFE